MRAESWASVEDTGVCGLTLRGVDGASGRLAGALKMIYGPAGPVRTELFLLSGLHSDRWI